jgi:hypothetical protein
MIKKDFRIPNFVFMFQRDDNHIEHYAIKNTDTNIIEFLNKGNINYNTLTFYIKPLNRQDATLQDTGEPATTSGAVAEEQETEEPLSSPPLSSPPLSSPPLSSLCAVCLDEPKQVVFMPCRHMACCETCGLTDSVRSCVICRTVIAHKITVFL